MFHSRSLYNKVNSIHEGTLKIAFNGNFLSFVKIRYRIIRFLAIETYKVLPWLSPPILHEAFVERDCSYNFRGKNFLNMGRVPKQFPFKLQKTSK